MNAALQVRCCVFWLKEKTARLEGPKTYSYAYVMNTPFDLLGKGAVWQLRPQANQKEVTMGDTKKLAHTKWNCKYHIVFAPKYRRQIFYREKSYRREVTKIMRMKGGEYGRDRVLSRPLVEK